MDLNELLAQLPPEIFFYGLMIPIICFGLIFYLTVIRPFLKRRQDAKQAGNTPESAVKPASTSLVTKSAPVIPVAPDLSMDGDMPDIGLLLTQTEAAVSVKPPQPPSIPLQPSVVPTGPRQLGEVEVALITGKTVRAREELVLLRDPADGRLIVQMPGVTYKSFASAPAVKETFSRLMTELAKSLGQPDDAPIVDAIPPTPAQIDSAPIAPATPQPLSTPLQPVTPPPPSPASPPPMASGIDGDAPLPGDLPKYSNARGAQMIGRGFLGRPKFEFERVPDLNLAESIEAYLQYRLAQTPGYGGRPWHVHSGMNGALKIEVNGQFFEAVSDITDEHARTFIQTAIQEWQDRQ